MKYLFLILTLLFCPAKADTVFKYGLGVFASAERSPTEVKYLSLGEQHPWFGPFITQYEGGIWTDTAGNGRKGAGLFSMSTGIKVHNPIYVQWLIGLALISRRDVYLGGNLQVNNELSAGVEDSDRNSIGISYKHLSSAGLFRPNVGRDFLLLRVSIPW